ncbi:MAG: SDR family oxidoreductase [Burkholderiales bacterium]|nr:SDR family oxidoreductase [Burkholderiales bacterium]
MQFLNKNVLITGAGSGIGRATAIEFARRGARVVVSDLNDSDGQATLGMLNAAQSGAHVYLHADIRRDEDVAKLIEGCLRLGNLDVAVNNAGAPCPPLLFEDQTDAQWDITVGTNLRGTWKCMQHEIRAMRKVGRGSIVNLASVVGLGALPAMSPYVASKFGIVGLTKAAALECAAAGIRVNCICPGIIATNIVNALPDEAKKMIVGMHPIGRMGDAEEVARAICWMASDDASFLVGAHLTLDGGYSAQ